MTATLGHLEAVPLRNVWAHEANDFTPWLAEPENLAQLADTLGLGELEAQGTEVPIGNFSIDILAKSFDGSVVVIENQFGSTDHTHLGQILTYAGGQEGDVTIVWIAENFREEHRAAIDWLNSSTIEGFNFFAVEIEALRIGHSFPAARFNVVGKPNEWSRGVTRTARKFSETPSNERQAFYVTYWSEFGSFLVENQSQFRIKRTFKDYWCGFRLGRSGIQFVATASRRDRRIGVELYISRDDGKATFHALMDEKSSIHEAVGEPLDWQELPDKVASRIAIFKAADPNDQAIRPEQFQWLASKLDGFRRAFYDRVRSMNQDTTADDDAGEA